jgi:hypothetical protein
MIEFRLQLRLTRDIERNRAELRVHRHLIAVLVLLSRYRQNRKGPTQKHGDQQHKVNESFWMAHGKSRARPAASLSCTACCTNHPSFVVRRPWLVREIIPSRIKRQWHRTVWYFLQRGDVRHGTSLTIRVAHIVEQVTVRLARQEVFHLRRLKISRCGLINGNETLQIETPASNYWPSVHLEP